MNRLHVTSHSLPDGFVVAVHELAGVGERYRSRAKRGAQGVSCCRYGRARRSGRLGSLEHGDMMKKLREALVAIDSENVHTGAAVRQGDPGTQILQFAKSLPADVIVMGAAGAERPTRPMGSVTATVVARSDCPVLIVPTGRHIDRSRAGVFKQILCAVDLAPSSVGVIRQALSLAWETHGHVTCVCVMTEPSPSPSEIRTQLLAAIPSEAHSWCDIEVVVKPGCQPLKSSESPRLRMWTSFLLVHHASGHPQRRRSWPSRSVPSWLHMTLARSPTHRPRGEMRAFAALNRVGRTRTGKTDPGVCSAFR